MVTYAMNFHRLGSDRRTTKGFRQKRFPTFGSASFRVLPSLAGLKATRFEVLLTPQSEGLEDQGPLRVTVS
jgi:hypothetical protein